MPVYRYRSIQDMSDDTWRSPEDPRLAEAIRSVWEFAARCSSRRFPPGGSRHRSAEEADRQRQRWEETDPQDPRLLAAADGSATPGA